MGESSSLRELSSVRVAVRIRPQGTKEKLQFCSVCTSVIPGEPQITIGGDRSFTYDYVFDPETDQVTLYEKCVKTLIDGVFDGYNATVLAYGQTGSGKTYSMGTAFETIHSLDPCTIGIIPRAVEHVFVGIEKRKEEARNKKIPEPSFEVCVQFVELYNEDLVDLLNDDRASSAAIRIHEDVRGEIFLRGVTSLSVTSCQQVLSVLKNGAVNRSTASTNMNEQSSRSHAIFTVFIKQHRVVSPSNEGVNLSSDNGCDSELEALSAKLNFVDLAGSERLKRTGATGDRAKEGISINCGLLSLGNVISALGGASGKVSHVPYRDSKLTRLLQDSLGGNSRTLMIACVSPSDCDFIETLNTLKYANRAKNIKNKVIANQDKQSKIIASLRAQIRSLESELSDYKQGKIRVIDGMETLNDQYQENIMLYDELSHFRTRVKTLQETIDVLRLNNSRLAADVERFTVKAALDIGANSFNEEEHADKPTPTLDDVIAAKIEKYIEERESLKCTLVETVTENENLRKLVSKYQKQSKEILPFMTASAAFGNTEIIVDDSCFDNVDSPYSDLIREAKADIERMKMSLSGCEGVCNTEEGSDASGSLDGISGMTGEDSEMVLDNSEIADGDDENEDVNIAEEECSKLKDDLIDIQNEISIKQRLVDELERSERRLNEVRLAYEKKLTELSLRITETEAERDRVLREMALKNNTKADTEQARRIKEEYEKKLAAMRAEFKKLKSLEQEHRKMQARQAAGQQQMAKLQRELEELKKTKVSLMQKIKDEAKRAKQIERENARKLAGMEKEARSKENIIRKMEMKDKQREMFIQRTTEEVNRLRMKIKENNNRQKMEARSNMNNLNSAAAQRVPRGRAPIVPFSAKAADQKWHKMEKFIRQQIRKRLTVTKMGEELERRISERQELLSEIQQLERRFVASEDLTERDVVGEQIDGCTGKMIYIQKEISDLQQAIVDIDNDGNKENEDASNEWNVDAFIDSCTNISETRYLIRRLQALSLEQGFKSAKAESKLGESEARIQQLEEEIRLNENLIATIINETSLVTDPEQPVENGEVPADSTNCVVDEGRRWNGSKGEFEKVQQCEVTADESLNPAENVLHQSSENGKVDDSDRTNVEFSTGSLGTECSETSTETTSPVRSRGHNKSRVGRIVTCAPRIMKGEDSDNSKLIVRTHTLEGHSKSVLSVAANGVSVITGSKDRTARLWDLEKGVEKLMLGLHPNNITCVRFIPNSSLAFTVSLSTVRIWDLRIAKNVYTLHSSGLGTEGELTTTNTGRQNTVPISETVITAAEVDPLGRFLFTTFSGDVRVWDLEKFAAYGRLTGASHSPRSEVSCLSVTNDPSLQVYTGSRDHYVKIYDVKSDGQGIYEATHELSPPHYDSITCVLPYGDSVFTASKDTNIMRFSTKDWKRDHLELKAHDRAVNDMCILEMERPLLATVCKAGNVKLWDITSTRRIRTVGEISQAHDDQINAITTDSGLVYTASNDTMVGVWRLSPFGS